MTVPAAPPSGAISARMYAGVDDLVTMQGLLMQGRALTRDDWRYPHLGDLMWSFMLVASHLDPNTNIRLWHNAQGDLCAYAILGDGPSFDCQVLPAYAGLGIEDAALAWAEKLVHELHRADPLAGADPLVAGASQDDAARLDFLARSGFTYLGRFPQLNMLRSLVVPVPDVALPPGCTVRALAPYGETADRAQAERDVWLPFSDGDVNTADYARLMQLPGYERELDIVALAADGVIAAYVNCWLDPLNRIGCLGPVGARPAYRRQGYTRAALSEGLRRLKRQGMQRACVSTTETNLPARRLYESVGFSAVNRYLDFEKKLSSEG